MRVAPLLAPDVEEILRTDPAQVAELAEELHVADLADVLGALTDDYAVRMLASLPLDVAAGALDSLDLPRRIELFRALEPALAARLSNRMSPDERADLFAELPEELRADVLARMERQEVKDVRQLLRYPETSAGGLMTTEFVALPVDAPVERAIEEVRRKAPEMETIYDAYAVDPNGTLLGAVSLRDLVLARPGQPVSALMDPTVISVGPETDREEVARLFAKYDLLAMPVVDPTTRGILGIVTVDDVVDVIEAERTEDIQRMAAVQPIEESYFATGFWTFVRKRASWLVLLFVEEMFTSNAINHFEWAEKAAISMGLYLSLYMPLIISSGGNSGSQSSALIVRSLAMGDVTLRDWGRVMGRELGLGLALGLILAFVGLFRVTLPFPFGLGNPFALAIVVSVSLVGVVTLGSIVGSMLPIVFRRLGFDPAVSSAPFIASMVDVIGLVIYFNIAIRVLKLTHH
jgi:magnesium transporter